MSDIDKMIAEYLNKGKKIARGKTVNAQGIRFYNPGNDMLKETRRQKRLLKKSTKSVAEEIKMWKLFIDDERMPVVEDEWFIARDFDDACYLVIKMGVPGYISFDHDLGQGPTGANFADWLTNYLLDNSKKFPQNFDYFVHSQNPIGAANIRGKMDSAIEHIGRES